MNIDNSLVITYNQLNTIYTCLLVKNVWVLYISFNKEYSIFINLFN